MLTKLLSFLVLVAFAAGCGIKAQTYVMTKDRVGIEKGTGNAGYLAGTPQYIEPVEKTRQVYVLELSKAVPESEVKKIEQQTAVKASSDTETSAPAHTEEESNKIVITPDQSASSVGPTEAVTYTVQKDDTLQKIAKKYYGSYGKWIKIYKANKDKIKNPNLLRSGTVITIPAAK